MLVYPEFTLEVGSGHGGLGQGNGGKPGAQGGEGSLVDAIAGTCHQGALIELGRQMILERFAIHQPGEGAGLLPLIRRDAVHVHLHHQCATLQPGTLNRLGQRIEGRFTCMDGAQQPVLLVALAHPIEGGIGKGVQR